MECAEKTGVPVLGFCGKRKLRLGEKKTKRKTRTCGSKEGDWMYTGTMPVPKWKSRLKRAAGISLMLSAVALFGMSGAPGPLWGQDRQANANAAAQGLEIVPIRPDFYMLVGAGGNIAVQTGPNGVVIVDSGSAEHAEEVIAAVKKLSDQPIRYIINTSAAPAPAAAAPGR